MGSIDIKYRIPLTGEYHKGIDYCPSCDHQVEVVSEHIIGFADSEIGVMAICECPKCFKKWRFHARMDWSTNYYTMMLTSIKCGLQKHFH